MNRKPRPFHPDNTSAPYRSLFTGVLIIGDRYLKWYRLPWRTHYHSHQKLYACTVQYDNKCNEEKIKYVIFLTKFHRKINGTGVEQAIFFFLSEQINYKLISYIMVKIITSTMTIYPGLG